VQKHATIMTSPTRNPKPPNFSFNVNRRLPKPIDGLNSSMTQSAAKLWLAKIFPERTNHTFYVTFLFLLKNRVLAIILAPHMLEFPYDVQTYIHSTYKQKIARPVPHWTIFGRNQGRN